MADTREQSVSISSGLVGRSRSAALVRALQTASDPHDYRIPDADAEDQFQLDHGEYRLKGWILERSDPRRLDEYDPWAGEISYPAVVPLNSFVSGCNYGRMPSGERFVSPAI